MGTPMRWMNTDESEISPMNEFPMPSDLSSGKRTDSPSTILLTEDTPVLAWLIILNGPRRGQLYRIHRQGTTIGRARDNDIVLEDETVSRHHARLLVESGIGRPQVYIQDLSSVNGVLVNGERIVRRLLEDGDRVTIGETQFVFKHL